MPYDMKKMKKRKGKATFIDRKKFEQMQEGLKDPSKAREMSKARAKYNLKKVIGKGK